MEAFNAARTDGHGHYAISIATPYRKYYALWRGLSGREYM